MMAPENKTVLLIESNRYDAAQLRATLERELHPSCCFTILHTETLADAMAMLQHTPIDVIVLELDLPDSQGLSTFSHIYVFAPHIPIVVISNGYDETVALQVMQEGAEDYLLKQHITTHDTHMVVSPLTARSLRCTIERHRMHNELQRYMQQSLLSERRFRIIIERSADGMLVVDAEGIIQFVNPAAEHLFERRSNHLVSEPFGFPMVAGETTELDVLRKNGITSIAEMRVVETVWENTPAYLATFRDITERKLAEARRMARYTITDTLAQSTTFYETIPAVLRAICEVTRWDVGEIWILNPDTGMLQWSGYGTTLTRDFTDYENHCRTLIARDATSLPMRVWRAARAEWIESLTTNDMHETLTRARLIQQHGFQSAAAFPILNRHEVTGVMLFLSRTTSPPCEDVSQMIIDIGNQMGQFIARRQAEDELRSAHRALRTLNECNQALVHANDESHFLHEICRIIVDVGGYRFAWAGFLEQSTSRHVHLAAQAGYSNYCLEALGITWISSHQGQGPIHTALRTGKPCIAKNIGSGGAALNVTRTRQTCGYSSSISLPLIAEERTFGVLNIYTEELNAFGKEEVHLLMEMANDLAYGIIALRTRAERDRAERDLRLYTERLKNMHEIDQAILTAQTSDAIAQATISHIRRLVPYNWASIVGFDVNTHKPVTLIADIKSDVQGNSYQQSNFAPPGTRLPLIVPDEHIYGALGSHSTARYVGDMLRVAERTAAFDELLALGIRSYISAPLKAGNMVIGGITLGATAPDAFNEQHISIVQEVADQLAVAMNHARLFEQVRAGRERLKTLSRRLMEVQEQERHHIARELHDEIGQSLTAIKMSLQAMQRMSDAVALQSNLIDSMSIVDHALQQVRNLSLDLRPSLLDDLGLLAALRWYIDRQAQWSGFRVDFITDDTFQQRLPADLETVCFRVTQEAITNIVRHAHATHVDIELRHHANMVMLCIHDDGIGFDVHAAQQHAIRGNSMGLLGMQERVLFAGGTIDITSQSHHGTHIEARFPIHPLNLANPQYLHSAQETEENL